MIPFLCLHVKLCKIREIKTNFICSRTIIDTVLAKITYASIGKRKTCRHTSLIELCCFVCLHYFGQLDTSDQDQVKIYALAHPWVAAASPRGPSVWPEDTTDLEGAGFEPQWTTSSTSVHPVDPVLFFTMPPTISQFNGFF